MHRFSRSEGGLARELGGEGCAYREGNVHLADADLELLATDLIRSWPEFIILPSNLTTTTPELPAPSSLLHNLAVINNPLELLQYRIVHVDLLADQDITLVIRVVGVAQPTIWTKLEFQKLVPVLPFVTDAEGIR